MSDETPFLHSSFSFNILHDDDDDDSSKNDSTKKSDSSGKNSLKDFFTKEIFAPKSKKEANNNDNDDDEDDQHYAKNAEGMNRLTNTQTPSFWSQQQMGGASQFLSTFQGLFADSGKQKDNNSDNTDDSSTKATSILEVAKNFTSKNKNSLQGGSSNNNKNKDMELFWELVQQSRDQWATVAQDSKAKSINPLAFLYYIGVSESKFTPSYKRRQHRLYPSLVDVETLYDLHDALYLATISYLPTVEDIQDALDDFHGQPWAMVYCDVKSKPREPAHFICLKRDQEQIQSNGNDGLLNNIRFPWQGDKVLDVLMVVRGTSEISDVLSDALIQAESYKPKSMTKNKDNDNSAIDDGYAHGGIQKAGSYLVEKHSEFLATLLKESKRDKIRLTLIGHSLGAGAASIACIEFNDNPNNKIDAKAVGFGCPPILSQKLSEATKDYITTVVCDADVVPRMSGATISNIVMDVVSTPFIDKALEDVQEVFQVIEENSPIKPPKEKKEQLMEYVRKTLQDEYEKNRDIDRDTKRVDVVLYPPGKCIHLYRDGEGISGSYVPCTFFNEIEISRTMLLDHLTASGYDRIFHELMRSHLDQINFTFRHDVANVCDPEKKKKKKKKQEKKEEEK